jgi:hypothetical protein
MAVRFDCPNCKANYEVADDLAGKMIMCRVCKKRGSVRSQSAPASSLAMPSAAAESSVSRRNFLPLAGLFVASLGAIGVGALLARQPWERGKESPEEQERRRRFREGRPPGDDKDKKDGKDGKEGAV